MLFATFLVDMPDRSTSRALVVAEHARGGNGARFVVRHDAQLPLDDGHVAVRVDWLSMDPFLHLRVSAADSARALLPVGQVMAGRGAGEVVASRHPGIAVGDHVVGELGWREVAVVPGDTVRVVRDKLVPLRHYLGPLGATGLAAWFLVGAADIHPGQTVVITGAAGGVGSLATQLAVERGASVVAVCRGGVEVAHLRQLGVTYVVDTEAAGWRAVLSDACVGGWQRALDGIGGEIFDALVPLAAVHARLLVFGALGTYSGAVPDVGPRPLLAVALKRMRIEGFLLADHMAAAGGPAEAERALGERIASGNLHVAETVVTGFERLPEAFASLLSTSHAGKLLVQLNA